MVTKQDHMDPVLNDNCLLKENDDSEVLDVSSLIPLWLKSVVWFFFSTEFRARGTRLQVNDSLRMEIEEGVVFFGETL